MFQLSKNAAVKSSKNKTHKNGPVTVMPEVGADAMALAMNAANYDKRRIFLPGNGVVYVKNNDTIPLWMLAERVIP
jgi:hypothetical protein